MGDEGSRTIEFVTMGCTWVLDLSRVSPETAGAIEGRWQRCIGLAAAEDTLHLDDEPTTVRLIEGPVPADTPSGVIVVSATSTDRLPYALSREITRAGLTRLRGRTTLLHAAALADDAGRTLALVAPSGGGKSTATRVLGTRLGYVSDESVILMPDGRIAPHPKPPSLVIDPADRFHKQEPAPDSIGLGPTPSAPHLAALLTLSRDAAVTEPSIDEVGLLDQVLSVIPETSSTWWLDDGLDRLARAITAGGPPARLRYAEIDTCHDLVREHLERAAPIEPTWEHLPAKGEQRLAVDAVVDPPVEVAEPGPEDRLVRGPWSDAIACDDEVLVLLGPRPLRLAGPGAILWRTAVTPTRLDELIARVTDELGDHPEGAEIVREAVAQLVGHGVLRRA